MYISNLFEAKFAVLNSGNRSAFKPGKGGDNKLDGQDVCSRLTRIKMNIAGTALERRQS